jgi:hypothetical protein
MDSLYLAQVVGLYLIIGGGVIMMRRSYLIPVVGTFIEERLARFIWSSVELIIGLFFVLGFQDWTTTHGSLLSVLAWMLLVEGFLYLTVPDKYIKKFFKVFNTQPWYILGGILSLIVGLYLAGVGFGWI